MIFSSRPDPSLDGLPAELMRRLLDVRDQYMRRLALRRWSLFCLFVLLATLLTSALLAAFGAALDPLIVWGAFGLSLAAGLLFIVVLPLRRPPSLHRIALFIDEHHPELENRVLSAVEFGERVPADSSEWMVRRVLEETDALTIRARWPSLLTPSDYARSIALAGLALVSAGALIVLLHDLWLPAGWWQGVPFGRDRASVTLNVKPGDARVRRGEGQAIVLETEAPGREALIRFRADGEEWRSADMSPGSDRAVYFYQFESIDRPLEYQVAFAGEESPTYRLTLWEPPEVRQVDLVYRYPAYLGLAPRESPSAGDISAVEGTVVDVDVHTNKPLREAALVLESEQRVPLKEIGPRLWRGRFEPKEPGRYHIELVDEGGDRNAYPERWDIALRPDEPPQVLVDFPRGDQQVTSLDRVPLVFQVEDDYGLAEIGVEYQLAGGESIRRPMEKFEPGLRNAEGAWTLPLEGQGLEPGDLVSWTVWARDFKPDRNRFEEQGDVYFLEVRPFRREYREAVSNQGGGAGMQGMQEDPDVLQKEIIIATWNLRRDLNRTGEDEFNQKLSAVIEAQTDLVQRVRRAAGNTSPEQQDDLPRLLDAMMRALRALREAEGSAPLDKLTEATQHEQTAYQLLLKMRPREIDVRQAMGGGGGTPPDISELEMNRNRNFYEEERRTQQTQAEEAAANDVLEKLRELAARQEMVNEEAGRLVSEMQKEDDARREELRRQLENLRQQQEQAIEELDRIRRQMESGEMDSELAQQTGESLEQAREMMNRSLEEMNREGLQEARSSGVRASDALERTEAEVEERVRGGADGEVRRLSEDLRALAEREARALEEVRELRRQFETPGIQTPEGFEARKEQLVEAKEALAEDYAELMTEAGDLAERSRAGQPLMSRKLGDWLRRTSGEGISEALDEGRKLLDYGIWSAAEAHEEATLEKLETAADRLDQVAQSAVSGESEALERALRELERMAEQVRGGGEESEVAEGGRGEEAEAGDGEGERDGEREGEGKEGGGAAQRRGEAKGAMPGESQRDGGETNEAGADDAGENTGESAGENAGESAGAAEGETVESEAAGSEAGGEASRNSADDGRGGGQQPSSDARAGRSTSGGAASRGGSPTAEASATLDLRRFFESDYAEWIEGLRNAQTLLPDGNGIAAQLELIRRQIESMRRDFRRHAQPPRYELFLETVGNPLLQATDALAEELARSRDSQRFILTDPGAVPHRYREQVARYFESLSELQEAGAESGGESDPSATEGATAGGARE